MKQFQIISLSFVCLLLTWSVNGLMIFSTSFVHCEWNKLSTTTTVVTKTNYCKLKVNMPVLGSFPVRRFVMAIKKGCQNQNLLLQSQTDCLYEIHIWFALTLFKACWCHEYILQWKSSGSNLHTYIKYMNWRVEIHIKNSIIQNLRWSV